MAHLLFNRKGNIAFYACTIVYLYGDLAIYAVGRHLIDIQPRKEPI